MAGGAGTWHYTDGMRGLALFFLAAAVMATAQTSGDLTFEVASVKPWGPAHDGPGVFRIGPKTDDPERIMIEPASMLRLLVLATGFDFDQISAPTWVATELYGVNAKVPPGTTKEQVRMMWQNLLAERFNLKFHYAAKDFPVYELTVAKNGPKLRKSGTGFVVEPGFPAPKAGSGYGLSIVPIRNVRQTFLDIPWRTSVSNSRGMWQRRISRGMWGYVSVARVVDKTGLAGTYDFTLEYAGRFQSTLSAPPLPDGQVDTAALLFDALRQQLGLQLEEKETQLPVLVVDHVDRVPSEN